MNEVVKNMVVTIDYSVKNTEGELLDAGQEPIIYLHGGYDDIFAKVEEALHGKKIGESVVVKLLPDEAFGEYEAALIQVESRDAFPKEIEVGMQFEGASEEEDDDEMLLFRVTEIEGDKVVLDGNHPLAGMSLVFTGTVTALRPASAEEITHGHVHGHGAHEHDDDEEDEDDE